MGDGPERPLGASDVTVQPVAPAVRCQHETEPTANALSVGKVVISYIATEGGFAHVVIGWEAPRGLLGYHFTFNRNEGGYYQVSGNPR